MDSDCLKCGREFVGINWRVCPRCIEEDKQWVCFTDDEDEYKPEDCLDDEWDKYKINEWLAI